MKLFFGLIGALLMVGFLASFVIKVQELAMIVVVLIGIGMMLVDLWQGPEPTAERQRLLPLSPAWARESQPRNCNTPRES